MSDDRRTGFSDSDLGRIAEAVSEAVSPPPSREEFKALQRRMGAAEEILRNVVRTEERQAIAIRQLAAIAEEQRDLRDEDDRMRALINAVDAKHTGRTARLRQIIYAYKRRLWMPLTVLFGTGAGAGYMAAAPELGGKLLGKLLELVAKGLSG